MPPPPVEESYIEEEVSGFPEVGFAANAGAPSSYDDDDGEKTQIGLTLPPSPSGGASFRGSDGGDARELRSKVTQLQGSLDDANERVNEREARILELEVELEAKTAEVDAARSSGGGRDKEVFSLRDAGTKKDKEILRLKSELHEKEKEIVELQETQNGLEQKRSEMTADLVRKDAAVKSLNGKLEVLAADRRKLDAQIVSLKEESRGVSSHLNEVQSDLEQALERLRASDAEVSDLRAARGEIESKLERVTGDADGLRSELEQQRQRAEGLRTELETSMQDLSAARDELDSKTQALHDEAEGLRKRLTELEEAAAKQEDRAAKLYARTQADETKREKTKQALAIALEMLDGGGEESRDEGAVA